MAAESPTSSELEGVRSRGKADIEKESYGVTPYITDGEEHQHHVIADKLARKLSARQVQMIAIGKLFSFTSSYIPIFKLFASNNP